MSESKHTAGPWTVEPGSNPLVLTVARNGYGSIATLDPNADTGAIRANAALIAAAPDMYEALRACAAFVETYTAHGVTEQPPAAFVLSDGQYVLAEVFAAVARAALAKAEGR